jgi:PEP-CTERM motif
MKYRHALAIALLGSGFSFLGHAEAKTDDLAYEATGLGSNLFGVVDLDTGVFTPHGSMGQTLAGLGSYGGVIYGGAYTGGANTLYSINTTTGALTVIGSGAIQYGIFGSTTSGLFAFGRNDNFLYSIDSATGAATKIGPTGLLFSGVMGMSAGSSTLYLTQNDLLYSLNTTTGGASFIGAFATSQNETGLGPLVTVDGDLYAGAFSPSNTPDIYRLDIKNLKAKFLALSPSTPSTPDIAGFWGFAPVTAVPEPATWAMMLLGFAGLGFAFRQLRRKVAFA